MIQGEFQRSVISMRLMAELAMTYGVALPALLRHTALQEAQLLQPDMLVSRQQELQLIENLVTLAGEQPALGIKAGMKYHATAFGALGFAVMSSSNIRTAMAAGLQYFKLTFAFSRFVVADREHEIQVELTVDEDVPRYLAAFIVERDLAALITVARDLYDLEPMLLQVQFKHATPEHIFDYQDFFRIRPQFNAGSNRVVFDRARMLQPLPQANELAYQAALAQCQQLLEARRVRHGVAEKVRQRLAMASAHMPTMEQVAQALCMTARTLRRHLQAEGVTFAELRDEVRIALADEFLKSAQLSIEQVAERLGYAESTSFIHAFKRWHGVTPHVFRQQVDNRINQAG